MTEAVQAEKAETETETGLRQDDVPWGRSWNWLLTNPEKTSYRRALANGGVLFAGALGSVYLVPGATQEGLIAQISTWVQVTGGSLGLVLLWVGSELRRSQKPLRDTEKLQAESIPWANSQSRRVSTSSGSQA